MCAIQEISARIGRVTGRGIAGNIRQHYSPALLAFIIPLLVIANVINIGADLGAMGAALKLLIGGPALLYVAGFGLLSVILEVWLRYARYVSILKWLTVSLFSYAAVVLVVGTPWATVAQHLLMPKISFSGKYLTVVVAILGTTISPYLFFWQAEEEVEDIRENESARPLRRVPEHAERELSRIKTDTYIGMGFSNLVALFILLAAATTLHANGVTEIETSADAAKALLPIAGKFAFFIFSLGIIGTGLLALPVLAGSAAFATGEALGWHVGLSRKPHRAKAFYAVIAVATLTGGILNFTPIDPIKALFWSAVVNGVVATPVMIVVMFLASSEKAMGEFVISSKLKLVGWIATLVMLMASVGMFVV
jgi:Mn2+/Fe2+ NRAMP family transporter